MSKVIGIDLGTTNSVGSFLDDNKQIQFILVNQKDVMPSCFYKKGQVKVVGQPAKQRGAIDPKNFICNAKRKMEEPDKCFEADGKYYSAEDVAVEVLTPFFEEMKKLYPNEPIEAMITVPANFRQHAKVATQNAGKRAGFSNVKLLLEPISSVIAYGFGGQKDGIYIVIDLGGGTLDISIVKKHGNNYDTLFTGGDKRLGGVDFTNVIVNLIHEEIARENRYFNLSLDLDYEDSPLAQRFFKSKEDYLRTKQKIIQAAENAKIVLSSETKFTIDIPNLFTYEGNPIAFSYEITRTQYERKANNLFNRFKKAIQQALNSVQSDENISKGEINEIIFAGGSMNLPRAKEIVEEIFNRTPLIKDLDKVVSIGAAVYGDSNLKMDPISRKSPIKKEQIVIQNKLSYNLGVDIVTGELSPILKQGEKYPPTLKHTERYHTAHDNQKVMFWNVVEGNVTSYYADAENKIIGSFQLDHIPVRPKGGVEADVTFQLNEDGILEIYAQDTEGATKPVRLKINWKEQRKE